MLVAESLSARWCQHTTHSPPTNYPANKHNIQENCKQFYTPLCLKIANRKNIKEHLVLQRSEAFMVDHYHIIIHIPQIKIFDILNH